MYPSPSFNNCQFTADLVYLYPHPLPIHPTPRWIPESFQRKLRILSCGNNNYSHSLLETRLSCNLTVKVQLIKEGMNTFSKAFYWHAQGFSSILWKRVTSLVQIKVTHQARGVGHWGHMTPSSLTSFLTNLYSHRLTCHRLTCIVILQWTSSWPICNERLCLPEPYQYRKKWFQYLLQESSIFGEFEFKSNSKASSYLYFRSKANHWKKHWKRKRDWFFQPGILYLSIFLQ